MSIRMFGQASTTMDQIQKQIDTIAHNLANVQTAGYKTRRIEFSSLLNQHINNLSDEANLQNRYTPDGVRVGTGARLGSTNANFQIGSAQNTDRPLDVMLHEKNHFFQIEVQDGENIETRYTRDGAFYLHPVDDTMVMLVTKDGHPVQGINGSIQFDRSFDSIQVNDNGDIVVNRNGQDEIVGTIAVSEITHPRLLETTGDNLYTLPNLAELGFVEADIVQIPTELNLMSGNMLEMANVNVAEEMSQLMMAQRAYQFNARSITFADQMQGLINQIR